MPQYRRRYVPGGTNFFTVVTENRRPFLCTSAARTALRQAMAEVRDAYPFSLQALVLLPDHLHTIWTLPRGDDNYSRRWSIIKRRFGDMWLREGGRQGSISAARQRARRRAIWQRRFWEHVIRDDDDLAAHLDYIHFNPVRHRLCESPADWPFSTSRRFVARGYYELSWSSTKSDQRLLSDRLQGLAVRLAGAGE